MMSTSDRSELRAAMNEASLLGPDSSLRHQVESDIQQAGTWAEEEWMDLLKEDELLRLELRRLDAPEGLRARLRRIPKDLPQSRILRFIRPLSIAATVLLLIGTGLFLTPQEEGRIDELALQNIVAMASDDHLNDRRVALNTNDAAELVRALQTEVGFEVGMPTAQPEGVLIGGRRCRWAGCHVIYSLWKSRGKLQSLIQFCPKQFKLPGSMKRRTIEFSQPGHPELATQVVIWAEDGKGFAKVQNSPHRT
ncbi:MAG: hypothetical protein ACYTGH_07605 [Planctomycetota bacterium]|jgi:hypothetical protein